MDFILIAASLCVFIYGLSKWPRLSHIFPREGYANDAETTMLLAKIMSIEPLLDMIWTNELAKTDHPVEEAKKLK